MDSATTDQVEPMYKTLENMRQILDKYDDVDIENIVVEGKTYNVNGKIEALKKSIFVRTETKRKKRKRNELKQTK